MGHAVLVVWTGHDNKYCKLFAKIVIILGERGATGPRWRGASIARTDVLFGSEPCELHHQGWVRLASQADSQGARATSSLSASQAHQRREAARAMQEPTHGAADKPNLDEQAGA